MALEWKRMALEWTGPHHDSSTCMHTPCLTSFCTLNSTRCSSLRRIPPARVFAQRVVMQGFGTREEQECRGRGKCVGAHAALSKLLLAKMGQGRGNRWPRPF